MRCDEPLPRPLMAGDITAPLTLLLVALLWPAGGRAEGGCLPHPPS